MKEVNIGVSKTIKIGRSCVVETAKEFLQDTFNKSRILVITDREVAGYYLAPFRDMIVASGKKVETVILEPGAQMKTMESLKPIFEKFVDLEINQKDYVFILGGGSVIDPALFAVSIFSVPLHTIVFPTTLFSMVEAGLAETACLSFQGRKDLLRTNVKSFDVIVDTSYLRTVPAKVITNGAAQIIQYGLLMNPALLTQLSAPKNIAQIIETAIQTGHTIKERDPRWLNMGRNIGDAIESHFRYYNYTPGEALALGLYACAPSTRLKSLYSRLGLPVCVDGVTRDTLMKRIEKSMRKTDRGVEVVRLSGEGKPIIKYYEANEALLYYEKALNLICR